MVALSVSYICKRLEILNLLILINSGLVHTYLALSKIKEALYASREAMKAMPQSAKALKLVGDVHASNSSGREKVNIKNLCNTLFIKFYFVLI